MCEATVVMIRGDKEEEIVKDAEIIDIDGSDLTISNILGRETKVEGKIMKIDLLKNRIFVKECS